MLMRKNNTRLTVDITWSGKVVDSKVVSTLVLINLEEKVFASDHFIVGGISKCFLRKLIFEVLFSQFTFNYFVHLLFYFCEDGDVTV